LNWAEKLKDADAFLQIAEQADLGNVICVDDFRSGTDHYIFPNVSQ